MGGVTLDERYRLTTLELVSGMVRGTDPTVAPLPEAPVTMSARAAFEAAVLRALQRPPCVVSFSGGRDSSAVLAVAAHVARREGLPLPVPVTKRFPSASAADETSWQELVVRHLDLPDWTTLVIHDELDHVGPYARAVLARHGPLWPPNLHSQLPIAEQAAGGTVLTGLGGDELLSPGWPWERVNKVIARQVPPRPRDLARAAVAYGPPALRRKALRRRWGNPVALPWLRPEVARRVEADELRALAATPVRVDRSIERAGWCTRYRAVAEAGLACVAGMHDAVACHPFNDALVHATIARDGGRTGLSSRTRAMHHLVGDLLPAPLIERPSKAVLTAVFWNRHTARFAATWDGTGVDGELVHVTVLREMWTAARPLDARTGSLLKTAWLASSGEIPREGPRP